MMWETVCACYVVLALCVVSMAGIVCSHSHRWQLCIEHVCITLLVPHEVQRYNFIHSFNLVRRGGDKGAKGKKEER